MDLGIPKRILMLCGPQGPRLKPEVPKYDKGISETIFLFLLLFFLIYFLFLFFLFFIYFYFLFLFFIIFFSLFVFLGFVTLGGVAQDLVIPKRILMLCGPPKVR